MALVTLVSVPAAADSVTIRMNRDVVEVFKSEILVRDVAQISSNNQLLAKQIGRLDLDSVAASKNSEIGVSREQVRMRIVVSGLAEDLDIAGPESVRVVILPLQHFRQRLEQNLAVAFAEKYSLSPSAVRVRWIPGANDQDFSARLLLHAQPSLPVQMPLGESNLTFKFTDESGQSSTDSQRFQITLLREMAVVKQRIPRGTLITANHISRVTGEVDSLDNQSVLHEQTIGQRAKVDLAEHTIVRASHLAATAKPIVVRRNDPIRVLVRSAGIQVTLKNAKAMKAGRIGDSIEILNPASGQKFSAVVTGKSQAEVR